MPLPTNGFRNLVIPCDADGNQVGIIYDGSTYRLAVDAFISGPVAVATEASPGTTITTQADISVGVGATVALPAVPANTRRRIVQVTGGDATTRIRIREVGAGGGKGIILLLYGSRKYGEAGGAIAALEVENVAGPAATLCVQDERD